MYYDEPSTRIVVLLPSDKSVRATGVSLVQSPQHVPRDSGILINFHIGDHATLTTALPMAIAYGGAITAQVVDMGDGVRYVTL